MKHSSDEKELIIAALLAYRQQYIDALANASNGSDNDRSVIQSTIDRTNALLARYGQ